jgi:hypothetical protein
MNSTLADTMDKVEADAASPQAALDALEALQVEVANRIEEVRNRMRVEGGATVNDPPATDATTAGIPAQTVEGDPT